MERLEKRLYELSIWEDKTESINGTYIQKEEQIAIIGSNTMTSKGRAISTKLIRKINGEIELSFEMMRRYWDSDFDKQVENPFLRYLVNERKIKLKRWDIINEKEVNVRWYDLIIKQVNETSDKNKIEITAKSIWVNELGRQGFSLTFSKEAMNSQGTIGELAEKVLEGSDWRYDETSYHPPQYQKNPVCQGSATSNITAYNPLTNDTMVLNSNSTFFVDYTKKDNIIVGSQIIIPYNENDLYDDKNIIKGDTLIISSAGEISAGEVVLGTKGNFLVQTQKSHYDKVLERYVYEYLDNEYYPIYENLEQESLVDALKEMGINSSIENRETIAKLNGILDYTGTAEQNLLLLNKLKEGKLSQSKQTIYGYEETDYTSGSITEELCTNGGANDVIVSTGGWFVCNEYGKRLREAEIRYLTIEDNGEKKKKGSITGNKPLQGEWLGNTGLSDKKDILETIAEGDKFVIAIKAADYTSGVTLNIKGVKYNRLGESDNADLFTESFNFQTAKTITINNTNWYYIVCEVGSGIKLSYSDLLKNDLLILIKQQSGDSNLAFTNFSYFRYIETKNDDGNVRPLFPGEFINAESYTVSHYFLPEEEETAITKDDYKPYTPINEPVPVYVEGYEMVRDIEAKESNRFNIIQSLVETFEVWPEFRIEHDENGAVAFDEDGRPRKYVKFNQYSGKDNYAGFRYGLNLKSIKRKTDSDKITSKIIVKPNSNQFAPNKTCRISEASENFLGEDFLYNFEYYINQSLIDKNKLMVDLYGEDGLYIKLPEINKNKKSLIEKISEINLFLTEKEAEVKELEYTLQSLEETKTECATKFKTATNQDIDNFLKTHPNIDWFATDANGNSIIVPKSYNLSDAAFKELQKYLIYEEKETLVSNRYNEELKPRYDRQKEELKKYNTELEIIKENATKVINLFEDKYSPYIQEGNWVSEDYREPNLYYFDAANVLATSGVPQLTYTIEVLAIDQLPEWRAYRFDLGDITYMEDIQFFGTKKDANGEITPKKEEIVVTEVTEELDEPSKDKIEVKNYKNRFEDLFQRITATTEALQFKEGEYNRSAAAITAQGKISNSVLNESLSGNNATIQNEKEKTVKWEENGIVIQNSQTANEVSKIVGNGLLVSNDGGQSWITGISPQGINAGLINGTIDCNKVFFKNTIDSLNIGKGIFLNTEDVAARNNVIFNSLKVTRNGILYGHPNNENWGYVKFNIDPKGIDTKNGSLDAQGMRIFAPFGKGMLQGTWYVDKDFLVVQNVTVAGTIYAKGGTSTLSDEKLKHSISLFRNEYDTFFDNLIPRLFKYNKGTSNRIHSGFIAQEVKEALNLSQLSNQDFAGLVIQNYGTEDEGDWNLRYEEFTSLNTWQIQKLKSRITELETLVSKLKIEVENLQSSQNSDII